MRKFILSALLICMTTTACVPLVFVAGATIGGAIVYDKRSIQRILEDQSTSQLIRQQLNDDIVLRKQTHIVVTTFNGIVLLAGQAPTPELKNRAYKIVTRIRKIRRIFNQITLEPPTPPITRSGDTGITAKVRAALLAKKGLHSTQIKVVTENGTVYLMGIVSRQQAHMASNTVREVSGVLSVVKLFEY